MYIHQMKLMEGRQKLSKTTSSGGGTERQRLLPDLPVEAAREKGEVLEVLDRVSQLEHRVARVEFCIHKIIYIY